MFEHGICLYRNGVCEQCVDGGYRSNHTSVWGKSWLLCIFLFMCRNIDIQGVYLFISVVNKNRNQNGPAPPNITGQKRLCWILAYDWRLPCIHLHLLFIISIFRVHITFNLLIKFLVRCLCDVRTNLIQSFLH